MRKIFYFKVFNKTFQTNILKMHKIVREYKSTKYGCLEGH